ncbi:alpha/beta fold hydrolase [Verminephrobacter aporrectodeae]|uniref:alpha/beta fold hydrolase n=1 Tax=Verminephrobacter aporrectodeae TaxID=1110389 RepID=UPI002236F8B6|nr:alpha/beta fold hydrolase [Verminephrobacter aporrectodeae]
MATFVLVHGAWHGGWCYERVARLLKAAGHPVHAPTLLGLSSPTVQTHVEQLTALITTRQLSDVILCGHSYGGMAVTGAADAVPSAVRALVYLDAVVPEDGSRLWDFLPACDRDFLLTHNVTPCGTALRPCHPSALGLNVADHALFERLCTPQPLSTFLSRISLSGAHRRVSKRVYVAATGWGEGRESPPPSFEMHERFRNDPSWATEMIDCGHDVMLDAPERLAAILMSHAAFAKELT